MTGIVKVYFVLKYTIYLLTIRGSGFIVKNIVHLMFFGLFLNEIRSSLHGVFLCLIRLLYILNFSIMALRVV